MKELDDELWELGMSGARPSTTRWPPPSTSWRPSSPNANRAIDENLLTMEKMTPAGQPLRPGVPAARKALRGHQRHRASTTTGPSPPASKNLLDPGENPMDNLRFLVFLTGVIEAVDEYQELLRMSRGHRRQRPSSRAPTRRRRPSSPSSWAMSWAPSSMRSSTSTSTPSAETRGHGPRRGRAAATSSRTTPTATAPAPSPSRATSSSSACPGSAHEPVRLQHDAEHGRGEERCKDFADADGGQDRRGVRGGRHRLHQARRSRDHKRIIFNGDGYSDEWQKEAAAPRAGEPPHHGRRAAVLRRAEKSIDAVRASSACSPRRRSRSRYEVKLEKYNKLHEHRDPRHEAPGAPRLPAGHQPTTPPSSPTASRPSTQRAAEGRHVVHAGHSWRSCVAGVAEIDRQLERLRRAASRLSGSGRSAEARRT